jgi:hypothetical protein
MEGRNVMGGREEAKKRKGRSQKRRKKEMVERGE